MRTQAQFTIYALNDVVTQATAPTNPYKGQLWVDTSKSPPVTKVWSGSAWKEANGTDTIRSNVTTITNRTSALETNVSGLTSTVTATVQQVETLEDDMGETQTRVTDLESTTSELVQTASGLATRVSDAEGSITTLTQNVSGITTRVTNAEGKITTHTTDISGLKTRVTSAEGKITTHTTDINGLKNRVTNAEGDISEMTETIDGIETRVGTAEGNISTITQNVSSVTTRVSAAEGKITTHTTDISGLKTRVTTAEGNISTITQNVSSITTRVGTAEGNITSLQQTTSSISATVSNKADKTGGSQSTFGWSLTSDGFYLYSGNSTVLAATSTGISVYGHIEANSGTLGDLSIDGRLTFAGNGSYYIDANQSDHAYYINLPGFRVDDASGAVFSGKLTAPIGTIGGFTISTSSIYKTKASYSNMTAGVYLGTDGIGLGAGTFYVNSSGYLYSKSGSIGGFTISTSSIYKTKSSYSSTTEGVYLGNDGIGLGAGTFYVTAAGYLYATNVSISGAINASSGTLGNLTITDTLYFGGNSDYYIDPNYDNGSWNIYLKNFRVDDTNAYFSGQLSAPTGNIGGFTISTNKIYKTKTTYNSTTAGVYIGTDGIGLGAGTFYVTAAGELYATSGKIGGMSLNASQMFSQNFILGTVYDASDNTKSFTTLSFGETSGSTFTATTVITNTGSYFNLLSSNYISCGYITCTAIKADPGISSSTGFYFGYSAGTTTYYAELSWSGAILYLKIFNSSGVQTTLTSSKSFTVHYACIWGGDTTWNATVSSGSSSTSLNTNAFWGIDYATFNYSSSNKSQHTYYFSVSGSSASTNISSYGNIIPYYNNSYNLGSAAYKWSNIYGQAGIVNTSDRNEKKEIQNMSEIYSRIFDMLVPVTFKFVENTSDRTHTGLIAQDVKDAVESVGLTTKEFAGYCEWENEDGSRGCGLRYGEFVSMNVYEIQKLKARVTELEEKIKSMEDNQNEIE